MTRLISFEILRGNLGHRSDSRDQSGVVDEKQRRVISRGLCGVLVERRDPQKEKYPRNLLLKKRKILGTRGEIAAH